MAILRFESIVSCPIAQVWQRFQAVRELLPALTPSSQGLIIEKVEPEPPTMGTRVRMSMRGPFGHIDWTAEYVDFQPPHSTITGVEARFVDKQIQGPFRSWVQSHEFEAASDRSTRCVDVIDYTLPLGPIGAVADLIAVRRMIRKMFAYRHRKMAELFA